MSREKNHPALTSDKLVFKTKYAAQCHRNQWMRKSQAFNSNLQDIYSQQSCSINLNKESRNLDRYREIWYTYTRDSLQYGLPEETLWYIESTARYRMECECFVIAY